MGTGGDALEGPSSLRYAFADPITANLEGAVTFEAPELPEETLMEVGISVQGLVRGRAQGTIKGKWIQRFSGSTSVAKVVTSKDGVNWLQKSWATQCSGNLGYTKHSGF